MEMNRNKKNIERLPLFSFAESELYNQLQRRPKQQLYKQLRNNCAENLIKFIKKIHSFNFAENHCNQSSRFRYLSLVNEARAKDKVSSDQENRQLYFYFLFCQLFDQKRQIFVQTSSKVFINVLSIQQHLIAQFYFYYQLIEHVSISITRRMYKSQSHEIQKSEQIKSRQPTTTDDYSTNIFAF